MTAGRGGSSGAAGPAPVLNPKARDRAGEIPGPLDPDADVTRGVRRERRAEAGLAVGPGIPRAVEAELGPERREVLGEDEEPGVGGYIDVAVGGVGPDDPGRRADAVGMVLPGKEAGRHRQSCREVARANRRMLANGIPRRGCRDDVVRAHRKSALS